MSFATPPDSAQRAQAVDIHHSFIVQAPAGSGKTELLTQRILALLAIVDQPEEVVAITFTRKAANEMRSRIIKALRLSTAPEPQEAYARMTWQLAKKVMQRSDVRLWHLLTHPNRLRLTTIDSLSLYLVGQMPVVSRMGIKPTVTEYPSPLYEQAITRLFQGLQQRPEPYASHLKTVLAYFNHDLTYINRLLIAMLRHREQWLSYAVLGQVDAFPAYLKYSLHSIITDELTLLTALVEEDSELDILMDCIRYATTQRALDNEGTIVEHWPGAHPHDLSNWQTIANLFLTKEGECRKIVDKRNGFPAASHFTQPEDKKSAVYYKKVFTEYLNFHAGQADSPFITALNNIRCLPASDYYEQQWSILSALLSVLALLASELRIVFQQTGKTDFIEIASAAKLALGSKEQPTDLLLSLDNQIKHLLVDEFQDTSVLQYELIEQLTAGWENGDGRTLFLVGDPMQSIYRFRQAEVGLFVKAATEGLGELSLTYLHLSANFRSDRAIVDWINTHFTHLFPPDNDIALGAISYAPSVAMKEMDIETGVYLRPCLREEDYPYQLLSELHGWIETAPTSSIAILVRSRKQARKIMPWLRAVKLPYQAIDIESLQRQPLIDDLLALTKACLYLHDKTAWLAVLRAPWCGIDIPDLLYLAQQSKTCSLWETLQTLEKTPELSEETSIRLMRTIKVLDIALTHRHQLPLRELIEQTWIALGGPNCLPPRAHLNDATQYFDMLEALIAEQTIFDILEFERRLSYLYAANTTQSATQIQLMTIHKSKGLEFDIVILPGLEEGVRSEDRDVLVWMDQPRLHQSTNDILLAISPPAGVEENPLYQYIRQKEKEKASYEQTRLLYVAATRAKYVLSLYFQYHPEEKIRPNSFLALLWPVISRQVSEHLPSLLSDPESIPNPAQREHTALRYRLKNSWHLPEQVHLGVATLKENEPLTELWSCPLERLRGIISHRCFRYLGLYGIEAWHGLSSNQKTSLIQNWCFLSGLPPQEWEGFMLFLDKTVAQIEASTQGQWLLTQLKNKSVQAEYAMAYLQHAEVKTSILDLTFIDEQGTRWIIDYKTALLTAVDICDFLDAQRECYRPQLEHYARLMYATDPRPIHLALYYPLADQWISWCYTQNNSFCG